MGLATVIPFGALMGQLPSRQAQPASDVFDHAMICFRSGSEDCPGAEYQADPGPGDESVPNSSGPMFERALSPSDADRTDRNAWRGVRESCRASHSGSFGARLAVVCTETIGTRPTRWLFT